MLCSGIVSLGLLSVKYHGHNYGIRVRIVLGGCSNFT